VDELLANGIEPWMTLYHWDLPQSLETRFGGWRSPETSRRFGDYVAKVTARVSDRVTNYFTINEFTCYTGLGYESGVHAPGLKLPKREIAQLRHNALLGHGLAVQAIRANARKKPNVGLAENSQVCVPVIETEEHIAAARRAFRVRNAPYLTAVMEGAYIEEYLKKMGPDAPAFTAEEMKIIGSPLDFVGMNMYNPHYIRADADAPGGFVYVDLPAAYPRMVPDWLHVGPQITYWGPRLVSELWKPKAVYITENGCACDDRLTTDKQVYDTDRVMYLRNHFINMHRTVSEGWPLKGYFLWSLLDNFEWARGYTQRFGIVYVNYSTQERIPKLSAKFYRETIARNAVV
jgi:beta-glucosidase